MRFSPQPLTALLALLLLAACAGPPPVEEPAAAPGALVVWSGLDEAALGPLVESLGAVGERNEPGFEVELRYADDEQLAAELSAGAGAMATTGGPDVLLADAVTLGGLAAAGRLRALPGEVTAAVPANFADEEGRWVGLTGRSREIVYDPRRTRPEELPQSFEGAGEERFRGAFALAPGDRSLVAHLAVYRALNGAAALADLLDRLAANQPRLVADDTAVVAAVTAGEVAWGLTGSDALCRHRAAAGGEAPPLASFHMPSGDASGFVGLTGAGVLTAHPSAAPFVAHLLAADTQARLVEATCSYPLVAGAEPPPGQTPLAELDAPQIDFGEVAAVLDATREAIAERLPAP